MGDGALGVHGTIVQSPVVAHNRIEQGVAIHLGQIMAVQIVLARMLNTKTAIFRLVQVCDILAKLDTSICNL